MVKKSDYKQDEVNACLSVMVELLTLLGVFRESIVLVGGWIPYFLFSKKGEKHIGSLDVDIALNFENISDETYNSILQILNKQGYRLGEQPFIFYRKVETSKGNLIDVEVDLVAAEYGGTGKKHRTQKVQDVRARKARGCDLAFLYSDYHKIRAKMPDGAVNEVNIKIAGVIPFLVMKGMTLWDRYKEKDAYDIYFVLKNYPEGIEKLIEEFKPFVDNNLIKEGLSKIKAKFNKIDAQGPVWVANFLEIDEPEERNIIIRDVFERVNKFLDNLNIEPYSQ